SSAGALPGRATSATARRREGKRRMAGVPKPEEAIATPRVSINDKAADTQGFPIFPVSPAWSGVWHFLPARRRFLQKCRSYRQMGRWPIDCRNRLEIFALGKSSECR